MEHGQAVNRGSHFSGAARKRNTPRTTDGLADYSQKDKPWDVHRGQAADVQAIYDRAQEFEKYGARISKCSGVLSFGWLADQDTGEMSLKLREASFCRVRHCPVCQWRRSLMWQARFYSALPAIQQAHPKARWIFLTLTVKNCPVSELGAQLTAMNAAWHKLIRRQDFAPVLGWVRTTEVTRGADGSAHPHFHALMMVPSSMLSGKHYVKQARWVELWHDCARLDYTPMVDVRAVRPKVPKEGQSEAEAALAGLQSSVAETLKYSVKPADMVADAEWFLEMTRQVHKKRFVATGGALKDVLRVDDETDDDLLLADEPAAQQDDGSRLAFNWRDGERRYARFPRGDKSVSNE